MEHLIDYMIKVTQTLTLVAIAMVLIEWFWYSGKSPVWFRNLGGSVVILLSSGYFLLILNAIWG